MAKNHQSAVVQKLCGNPLECRYHLEPPSASHVAGQFNRAAIDNAIQQQAPSI